MDVIEFLEDIEIENNDDHFEIHVRVFRDRLNPFDYYSDTQFRSRYRFWKPTVREIINMIEGDLRTVTRRSYAINPENQVSVDNYGIIN